ncbi:hypothetical protein MTR67_039387 [Solanum verrucosum]|uniref:Integrase catalytic domain-containing protein n=1 Tax=Solanum verrucosum TaxID=315347 RepID=A0AAF0UHA9_SOLVR|nr:hypothetical protein MTR67_039387 [Solanum verrucosum]
MSNSAHFIPVKASHLAEDYDKVYIREIVKLHGVPLSIISDRGPQFTSHFWKSFQKGLGTKVKLSTAFHPQMDGRCMSLVGWFEVGDIALIDLESVYEAIEKVLTKYWSVLGNLLYELDLPNELALVHSVFHVSMLKMCVGDPVTIIPLEGLGVDESLSHEEVSVEILDRQIKKLRNKEVASVKVLWRNDLVEGATWEAEADMKSRYPHLFPSTPTQA